MDEISRALNWLTENDSSIDAGRAAVDVGWLKRMYDRYDRRNRLSQEKFLECVTLVRLTKATIILMPLRDT